ncbi:MAG: IclR family transcriptional regulator [Rhodospirillales bacterium]|nr:IclR family transcriptional regulator [Rhodospirillales bacterium]
MRQRRSALAVAAGPAGRRTRASFLDRTLQILDHLQQSGRPASPYEIGRSVGAPASSIYAVIDSLLHRNLLSRAAGNRIWLGPRLHHYGLAYARALDLLSLADPVMRRLAAGVGETVQICGRDGESMVVLAMVEGPGHFPISARVGTRLPLNWTASGRLLAGHLPRAERVALFGRAARPSPTGRAPIDPEALSAESAVALAQRIAIQLGQSAEAVACIAAPIRDHAGACLATISIVTLEERARRHRTRFVAAVQEAAAAIEERLGEPEVPAALSA